METQEELINPIQSEAIAKYVRRRGEDLKVAREALLRLDYSVLHEMAHKILGNCLTFGFGELHDIAADIQREAQARRQDGCERALGRLKAWLEEKSTPLP